MSAAVAIVAGLAALWLSVGAWVSVIMYFKFNVPPAKSSVGAVNFVSAVVAGIPLATVLLSLAWLWWRT